MISIIDQYDQSGVLVLRGLSTDAKPIGFMPVGEALINLENGSEFEEIDTGKVYYYDEQSHRWCLV